MTIAIIGAGMAGLSAARDLTARGQSSVLFDKGRGPGGRMSSRRMETELGLIRFDHGAQYFTVSDPAFGEAVATWECDGIVAPWRGKLVTIDRDGLARPLGVRSRFVGQPGMSALIRHEAADQEVHWSSRVVAIDNGPSGVALRLENGVTAGPFEKVIVATPAEQAAELLHHAAPELAAQARAVRSAACWTLMCLFDNPLPVDWDGARLETGPLGWVARDGSKPGRVRVESWVLHASPDWSRRHIDLPREEIGATLLTAFQALATAPAPNLSSLHLWRYARSGCHQDAAPRWSHDARLGICGDWCADGRIEGAWKSGKEVVRAACPAL